jgi:hypothetical protein
MTWKTTTFRIARRVAILLLVPLAAVLTMVYVPVFLLFIALAVTGKPGCERHTASVMVSPDEGGADDPLLALLQESVCTDSGFVTVMTEVVQLVPRSRAADAIRLEWQPHEPEHEDDVLVVQSGSDLKDRPVLQWISASKLQVTLSNSDWIGLRKSSHRGVEIVIIGGREETPRPSIP